MTPERCFTHIRRYSTAVILASVFGQRGASYEAPKVKALYHAQEQFTEILASGATPPVDPFPFLKYMPTFLAPYKRWAAEIRQEQRTLYSNLLNETVAGARKQDRIPCFMDKLLEGKEKSGLDDEQIVYTGGILVWYSLCFLLKVLTFGRQMEAGSDTTSSTLHSFVLAMIKYPEVLQRAQKELDEVCGSSKSPSSQDVKNLPYMQAIMTEVGGQILLVNSLPNRPDRMFIDAAMEASSARWRPSHADPRRHLWRLLSSKGHHRVCQHLVHPPRRIRVRQARGIHPRAVPRRQVRQQGQ